MTKYLKKHLLEALSIGEKLDKYNTQIIPLYETFGIFLSSYLIFGYNSGKGGSDFSRNIIQNLMRFSDEELKKFAHTMMKQLAKYIQFISQVLVRMWDGCTDGLHRFINRYINHSERLCTFTEVLALIQFLLISCPSSLSVLLDELQCGLLSEETPKDVPEKFKALYKEEVSFRLGNIFYGEVFKSLVFFFYTYNEEKKKEKFKQQIYWTINRIMVMKVLASKKETGIRYFERVKICKELLDEIPDTFTHKSFMDDTLVLFKETIPENPKLRKFTKKHLDWFNPYDLLKQGEYQQSLRSLAELSGVLKINLKDLLNWPVNDTYSKEISELKVILAEFVKNPKVWNYLVSNLQKPDIGENKKLLSLKLLYDSMKILKIPEEKLREILLAIPNPVDSTTFYGGLVNEIIKRPKKEEEKSPTSNYKKKQNEVMKKFLERQKQFANKHTKEIEELPKSATSNICVICRENMSEKDSYGVFALISATGVNTTVLNWTWKNLVSKFSYSEEEKEAAFARNNMGIYSHAAISTCNHFLHENCFKDFLSKTTKGSCCPVCKSTYNCFIVANDRSKGEDSLSTYCLNFLINISQNDDLLYDLKTEVVEEQLAWLIFKFFLNSLMVCDVLGVEEAIAKKRIILRRLINVLLTRKNVDEVCDKFIEMQMNDMMCIPVITLFCLIKYRYWGLSNRTKINEGVISLLGAYLRQISVRYAYEKQKIINSKIKDNQKSIKKDFEFALKSIAYTLSICTDLSEEDIANMIKFKNISGTAQSLLKFFNITFPPFESFFRENSIKSSFTFFNKTIDIDKLFASKPIAMSLLVEPRTFDWSFKFDERLDILIEKNSSINCSVCESNCSLKGICLICGTVLCFYSRCCEYEILIHAASCGKGSCMVFLLYKGYVAIVTNLEQERVIKGLYTNDNGEDASTYTAKNQYTLQEEYKKFKLNRQTLDLLRDIYINSKEVFIMNQYSKLIEDY
jgi:hypothetical protein